MPVLLEGARSAIAFRSAPCAAPAENLAALDIGLVNNMPDGALHATERQFVEVLSAAAGERTVRLHLFALPGIARGPGVAAHVASLYSDAPALLRTRLDGLIVTGCEPRAAQLPDEPFWADFARLVDWAAANTTSTLWSCLAAHAAVLHLDGIARRRLPAKRSGVFTLKPVAAHALTAGLKRPMQVSHSRWNDLAEEDLAAGGYSVLTRAPEVGVDLFAKRVGSLFVFFQGHPEYDADTLGREYRRDMARFLKGEQAQPPTIPATYFHPKAEAALAAFAARAQDGETGLALRDMPRELPLRPGLEEGWRMTSLPVFRAWLDGMAEGRQQTRPARKRKPAERETRAGTALT